MKANVPTTDLFRLAPLLLVIFFLTGSCKKDDTPDPREGRLQMLSGTWRLGTVENDGLDVTDQYQGFTVTFTATGTYTTTSGGNPWPTQGSYEVKDNDLSTLVRDDDIEIKIGSISESALTLSFTKNTVSGRANGVTGDFTFSLIK